MKMRFLLSAIIVVIFLTGCGSALTKPKLDEISMITLKGPCGGAHCQKSYILSPNDPKDKKVIEKIINWLNSFKEVGEAKNEFMQIGGQPRYMEIQMKNGDVLSIRSSVNAIGKDVPNGYEVHSEDVNDQITVYQKDKKPIRVTSPEIKTWINGKWEQDISK